MLREWKPLARRIHVDGERWYQAYITNGRTTVPVGHRRMFRSMAWDDAQSSATAQNEIQRHRNKDENGRP